MHSHKLLAGLLLILVVGITSQCLAQEARIVMPAGVVNRPYSRSIPEVLKEEYNISSQPSSEWQPVGPVPAGFDLEHSTGTVFGTSVTAETHLFRVQRLDRSVKGSAPLKLLISLQIKSEEDASVSPPVQSQVTPPKPAPPVKPDPDLQVATGAVEDVEIPSVVPRKNFNLPIKIKNDSIRQLEVIALNRTTNKTARALTRPDLPRGEALTSVDLQLEEGDYTVYVSDAATKKPYRTFNMTVRGADVDKPAETTLELRHSGFASKTDDKTSVTVVAGPKVVKVSVAAFEKGADGQLTKPLDEIKAPTLTRETDSYPVVVPLSKSSDVTKITVKDLTPGSNLEKSIEIKKAEAVSGQGTGDAKKGGAITIERPANKSDVPDVSVDTYVKVAKKSGITKVRYRVTNGDRMYTEEFNVNPTEDKDDEKRVRVRILGGTNVIRFVNANDETNPEHQAAIEVTCNTNCASSFTPAQFAGSQNSRSIVGLEQAGASSADSESKPFVDFFFSTPFIFSRCPSEPTPPAAVAVAAAGLPLTLEQHRKKEEYERKKDEYEECIARRLPRLGAWGNVRLTTTPDQIAAVGVLPSNFANQLGNPSNTVDLVQSFDFLMGLEGRLFTANSHFLSLIPGLPQKTHFYLAAGGGAINPLTARRELAQIFKIPATNSPQRDEFIARYGTPPTSEPPKEFVGLVPLDRDRFLRQWYFGLRLKTFYCRNAQCDEYENNFPSLVDFMFGQNEAVTGGSLHYLAPDPNDSSRTIKKRSYVLRFDAFYPFPLQRANFLYFYGTAIMKVGAGGVRVQNPLFLDTASGEVLITDPRVYIPPSDLQKIFQPNRDYYKLGIGIDLIGLINRARGRG